jgi:hypothetical protein
LEGSGCAIILRYPDLCLEGLRKTMKTGQDSWSVGQDLNPRPSKYKAGVFATRPRRLVADMKNYTIPYIYYASTTINIFHMGVQ